MSEEKPDNGAASSVRDGRAWVADRLAKVDKEARSFLTVHPIVALACAVGIGFVAARLLSGRGSKHQR